MFILLYKQLFVNTDFTEAFRHFKSELKGNYLMLVVVVFLMLLNWSLETIKWKLLIDKIHFISWLDAIEGILFGITFSLFTPSRVGEFGGRVFALESDRIQAIVSTVVGSASQMVVNLSLGSIGFLLYLLIIEKTELYSFLPIFGIVVLLIVLLHVSFFNLDVISSKFPKIKQLDVVRTHISIIQKYSLEDLVRVELLSLGRYIIYTTQFIVLLYFFDIQISLLEIVIIATTIFLFQTINPFNIALIDFGFRGNVALYFLSAYTDNNLNILAATILLWFVNLIIPAIFGGISALKFKFVSE